VRSAAATETIKAKTSHDLSDLASIEPSDPSPGMVHQEAANQILAVANAMRLNGV
jgi:hypothetical protein